MPDSRFQSGLDHASVCLAAEMISTVLHASDPEAAIRKHLDAKAWEKPTHILSFGKASIPMTNAAIDCLGDRFARATVLAPPALCAAYQFKNKFVELLEADHPLPTLRNIQATKKLIEHAQSIPNDHDALVLVSGGSSAMLCAPKEGVELEQIATLTDGLLQSGASIHEINAARSSLDTIKAGGLGRMLSHVANTQSLILCDVISRHPSDQRELVKQELVETVGSGPTAIPEIEHTIIASNDCVVDALCGWIAHQRIEAISIKRSACGHASREGVWLANQLLDSTKQGPSAACLGGEPTVDTQSCSSDSKIKNGVGGPMLELALACAYKLRDAPFSWTVIAFATDGVDGPTDAAGAVITSQAMRGVLDEIDVEQALEAHNSLPVCDHLYATIRTGPTGTNVNDVAVAIRWD